jgi:hypothetical protein
MANMPVHPDYVAPRVTIPDPTGPAQYLADGTWCGHGEPLFNVFDVRDGAIDTFVIRLPRKVGDDELLPNAVELSSVGGSGVFLAYDPRRHPANLFAGPKYSTIQPQFAERLACHQCGRNNFKVAIGFAVPSDSSSPNDTSWFALAAACANCGAACVVFDDETA